MISSGIIKRGLATTAISALAVAGIPALAGTAHAAVGSIDAAGVNGWTAFDIDEFTGAPNDIIVTVKETGGTPTVGQAVEFSYVYTTPAGVASPATAFSSAGNTNADGQVFLDLDPAAVGTYAITVRTVGTHVTDSTPLTIVVGESEITLADGASATSPIGGSDTYTGTLALVGTGTPLAGRRVNFAYTGTSVLSPLLADTAADGSFSTTLTDNVAPPGDTGTLTATAPALTEGTDVAAADATDSTVVTFAAVPPVTHITVADDEVFNGEAPAPGKPVEIDVIVRGQAVADATPENDPVLQDYPVKFTVDKGFLTPDTQGPGLTVDPTELKLTAEQDDLGDLFGFYENLGADETVDTSDDAGNPPTDSAGIVATIEKDAGFNDDGRVKQVVTVTAGGKSANVEINYDVRNHLNMPAAAFRRDGGSARVPGSIDLKLYSVDQYGNLVGDQPASISDNTPVARVTPETGGATTDFVNDNPAATASSSRAVSQVITASIAANEATVNASGNPVIGNDTDTVEAKHTINWGNVPGPGTGRDPIVAKLKGRSNGGKADRLTVVTLRKAAGARVQLFKIRKNGKQIPAGTKVIGSNGRVTFVKADRNGRGFTKYIAKVKPTSDTKGARTNRRNVR